MRSPVFFSRSDVRIILYGKDEQRAFVDTEIANDGKRLDESNWRVKWENSGGVEVRLMGEEHKPQVCVLHLDGKVDCHIDANDSVGWGTSSPSTVSPPPGDDSGGQGSSVAPTRSDKADSIPPTLSSAMLSQQLSEASEYSDDRAVLETVANHLGVSA